MIKLEMKNKFKKLISIIIVMSVVLVTMAPVSMAAVTYPQDITKEQALSVIDKTDTMIHALLKQLQNTTLKNLVLDEVCTSQVLSMLLIQVYKAVEEQSESMSILGLKTAPYDVATFLDNYPNVKEKLGTYSTWAEVDLSDVDWGVSGKDAFINAAAAMFGPFNDLLYTLLCGGSYPLILIVGINGAMGYENAIVPILKNFGCKTITDSATFYSDAENDRYSMVRHILYDVFAFAEDVLDAPCSRLTDVLPGIAYFIKNNGLQNSITTLISPLKVQVLNIPLPIEIDTFMSSDQISGGFTFDINLGDMGSVSGFKTAEIDLELFASCGTVQQDGSVVSDKADTFISLLRWLIETVKLNEQSLTQIASSQVDSEMTSMFGTLLSKPADDIITVIIQLLNQSAALTNNYQWTFNQNVQTQVSYTANLGQDKYQRVLDGIDELLNDFVKEGGTAQSVREVLMPEIYSNKIVSSVVVELYNMLLDEKISQAFGLLNVSTSPSSLAATLNESQFANVKNQLNSHYSWATVPVDSLNWGFTNGDKDGFINAVSAAFRPFDSAFRMLLAGGKIQLFDTIEFYGSDGYNTAVIPVLEAFGVYIQDIPDYNEYVSAIASQDVMKPIVTSLCSLIERVLDKPVYTITEILPNLLYFVNNNGIEIIVENLMYPLSFYLEKLGISELLDTSEFTGVLNIQSMISDMMKNADLGFVLPELDINQFQGMGQLTSVESRRTMSGNRIGIYAVKADQTAVLITFLRYLVSIIKTPGNENLLTSFISSATGTQGASEGDMLTSYLMSLNDQIGAMSVDETVEWLYQIFFKESVVVETTVKQEYEPTIIYEETTEEDYFVLLVGLLLISGAEVVFLRNKNRISNYRQKKKTADNKSKDEKSREVQ